MCDCMCVWVSYVGMSSSGVEADVADEEFGNGGSQLWSH